MNTTMFVTKMPLNFVFEEDDYSEFANYLERMDIDLFRNYLTKNNFHVEGDGGRYETYVGYIMNGYYHVDLLVKPEIMDYTSVKRNRINFIQRMSNLMSKTQLEILYEIAPELDPYNRIKELLNTADKLHTQIKRHYEIKVTPDNVAKDIDEADKFIEMWSAINSDDIISWLKDHGYRRGGKSMEVGDLQTYLRRKEMHDNPVTVPTERDRPEYAYHVWRCVNEIAYNHRVSALRVYLELTSDSNDIEEIAGRIE